MLRRLSFIFTLLSILTISMVCHAEVQHIEAVGTYVLGDRDTRDVAERRAIKDAVRVATEKAGYYVESYSKTENFVLTADEVKTIAASILHVYDQETTFINNGTVCQATVYATAKMSDIGMLIDRERGTTEGGTKQRKQPRSLAEMGYEVKSSPVYETEEQEDVSSYTGIVIDCLDARGRDMLAIGHTGIESNVLKTKSGRILLDYRTPIQHKDFTYIYGLTEYRPDAVEAIAGSNPYWVHALYIEPQKHKNPYFWGTTWSGTIVISDKDGDVIEDMQDRLGILNKHRPPVVAIGGWVGR